MSLDWNPTTTNLLFRPVTKLPDWVNASRSRYVEITAFHFKYSNYGTIAPIVVGASLMMVVLLP